MAVLGTRIELARLALPQPLAVGLLVLSIVSLAYYVRLALIGVRRPSVAVASGADPMPRLARLRREPLSARGRRAATKTPLGARDQLDGTLTLLRTNRAPIAAGLVLVLTGLAVAVSAGGFGVEAAAAGDRPEPALPLGFSTASPSPTPAP
jgi:hypothetical protein